jgi:hypothetical protein
VAAQRNQYSKIPGNANGQFQKLMIDSRQGIVRFIRAL